MKTLSKPSTPPLPPLFSTTTLSTTKNLSTYENCNPLPSLPTGCVSSPSSISQKDNIRLQGPGLTLSKSIHTHESTVQQKHSKEETLQLINATIQKWKKRFYDDALLDLQALNELRTSVGLLSQQLRLSPTSILPTGVVFQDDKEENLLEQEEGDPKLVLELTPHLSSEKKETLKRQTTTTTHSSITSNVATLLTSEDVIQSQKHTTLDTPTFLTATNLVESLPQEQKGTSLNPSNSEPSEFLQPPKKNDDIPQMPVFSPNQPTPLPNKLNLKEMFKSTLDHRDLHTGFLQELQRLSHSDAFTTILSDLFWWFYIDQFMPNAEKSNQKTHQDFYDRISSNYVYCLLSMPHRHRDDFVKDFPDIVSETLFQCFRSIFQTHKCHSQVNSIEFRKVLVDSIYMWMTGIQWYESKWTKWMNSGTNPSIPSSWGAKKSKGLDTAVLSNESGQLLNLLLGDENKNASDAKSRRTDFLSTQSHPYGPGPPSHRVRLDIYANSPMVQHFFKLCFQKASNSHHRVSYIHFHQVERFTKEMAERPTYRTLLMDSLRQSKKAMKTYLATQETLTKERTKANSDVTYQLRQEEQKFTKKLTKVMEVKVECEKLLTHSRNESGYSRQQRRKGQKKRGTRVYQKMKLVPLAL
ncbi:hypothetical protein HMI55_005195 [Coelomomyces lativittatus]|nr:hypothetical protein HMI56_003550 [Coelomomyces lativittatus]KAJ1513824.1 hypothetical protein HMI55_005195 [Coelomomyces lativittatus]